jgi:hypothetical protein
MTSFMLSVKVNSNIASMQGFLATRHSR